MLLDSLQFSLGVTLPTILMLLIGIILKYYKMIDDYFCQISSKLVFNIALPALLFINIVKQPTDYFSQITLISGGFLSTLIIYLLSEWVAFSYIKQKYYRGIFVQGVFRGNSGILGLALCINAYGALAIAPASIYTACITLLFNVLAVITLTHSLSKEKLNFLKLIKSLITNPLIIAILTAILLSKMNIAIPEFIMKTGSYLGNIALPIALICGGASLNFTQIKLFKSEDKNENQESKIIWFSCIGRLIISPLLTILIGKYLLDLEPMLLGILFLMSSTPVAAVSYAMVRNFGGDSTMAANILALSTLGYMFTSSTGLFILKQMGWI